MYKQDVSGDELFHEITDLRMILLKRDKVVTKPIELLNVIIQYGNDVFPNLRISLHILLTFASSIASCERSFSKLKLIMNYLRTTMSQERLNNLAMLSIEREEAENTNFEQIIDIFAATKARKACL